MSHWHAGRKQPKELWSLFHFWMPGFLCDSQTFKSRYQTPIEKERNEVRLVQLRYRVAPFILRRMKSTEAKDLPPKTEIVRPVELDGDQRDFYESIWLAALDVVRQVIRKKGLQGSAIPILDALMKLRQVCCDPRLIASPAARAVKTSLKVRILDGNAGDSAWSRPSHPQLFRNLRAC